MDVIKFSILVCVFGAAASASVVDTSSGLIQGIEMSTMNTEAFLGIPYAEAPEGELRFKPPVRKARMGEIYHATSNGKICPQIPFFPLPGLGNFTITEDCLRLDIYKPRTLRPSQDTLLPVMVWIHGGAYQIGDTRLYAGSQLASQFKVIMVAANYRLGLLGFLNTMDENSVGNFGLRDQCSAIEWVVDNIAAFGGNASQITIFGESAGSGSVLQLAMSSLCQGKFQRVIAQSGTPFSAWSYNDDPLKSARKLAADSSCPSESGALVACLRQKSVNEILALQPFRALGASEFVPSYTEDIFPDNPLYIMGKGDNSDVLRRFRGLDLLLGVMENEGELEFVATIFGVAGEVTNLTRAVISDDEVDGRILSILELLARGNNLQDIVTAVKCEYTEWDKQDIYANTRKLIRINGDLSFVVGSVNTARLHSRPHFIPDNGNTYFYIFNRKPSWNPKYPWSEGGSHADDVYFLFGYTNLFGGTSSENLLAQQVMEYWTNFAKTGNPNYPSNQYIKTSWPAFNTKTEKYIELDVGMSRDSVSQNPFGRKVAFWEMPRSEMAEIKTCVTVSGVGSLKNAIHHLFLIAAIVYLLF